MSDAVPLVDPPGHRYRLLTGPDDATFCTRISEALAEGYTLYGSPSVTFDGERVIAAQAVLWPHPPAAAPAATSPAAPPAATAPAAPSSPHTQNGDDR
ncbi:MAG TPA: DUF1737 domain-containing protein [Ruania sp.]|nr:DUF1737 domain-containing protein [Ruania sp.]